MDSLQTIRTALLQRHDLLAGVHRPTSGRSHSAPTNSHARALLKAYSKWQPTPRSATDAVEIFAPALLRINASTDTWSEAASDFGLAEWIRGLLHLCLYADRVYVPDPLEILARKIVQDATSGFQLIVHEPLVANIQLCIEAAKQLVTLDPLIEAGIVVLYPPLGLYLRSVAENLFLSKRGFTPDEMANAWPERYVEEGLYFANAFDASYTALHRDEYRSLEEAGKNLQLALGKADAKIITTLPAMKLPFFQLDANVLVKARQNEGSFEDFRLFMRQKSRKLAGGIDDPDYSRSTREFEEGVVEPALQKLQDDITGISSLKKRLREAPIDFVAGAIASIVLKGDVLDAVMTGGVGALSKALMKTIWDREKLRPAASTVYLFHTGNQPPLSLDVSLRAIGRTLLWGDKPV